ncbi:MAG: hypothetical protein IT192_05820 [Microbacteriaceae bacterium]|nr:hypothetical protein [Microbacteriaceae bacterium]
MEIDEDLVPFIWENRDRHPHPTTSHYLYITDWLNPPTVDQLMRAVKLGLGINLLVGPGFSLTYLEPVIEQLTYLALASGSSASYLDAHVLERALNLRQLLWWSGDPAEPVDLSSLPNLTRVRIHIAPNNKSILANPNLRELTITSSGVDPLPKILAPLEDLALEEGKKVDRLPELSHPVALKRVCIISPRFFDAASLLVAPNLEMLDLRGAGRFINVDAFPRLKKLQRVWIDGSTEEDWDVMANCVADDVLLELGNDPSRKLLDAGYGRKKWTVIGPGRKQVEFFDILPPWEPGEGAVLHFTFGFTFVRKNFLESLTDSELPEVDGILIEDLIRLVCARDKQLASIQPEYDSRREGTFVAFPDKKSAARVARLTSKLMLDQNKLASTVRDLLRNPLPPMIKPEVPREWPKGFSTAPRDPLFPFNLEDDYEGDGILVRMSDFASFEQLMANNLNQEELDDHLINGHFVEELMRLACNREPKLADSRIQFDSEADEAFATFPNRTLARRVIAATLALL